MAGEYEKELRNLEQIKAVADLPGVKEIQRISEQAAKGAIVQLATGYMNLTHEQMMSLCATLRANLEIIKTISSVDNDIEIVKDLIIERDKNPEPESENT